MEEGPLVFFVNGKRVEDAKVDPEETLLYYLRNTLKLCGTKLGCGEGGCGACTVMVSHFKDGKVVHRAVNACLAPVMSVHLCAVTTVEGIGSTKTKLHKVQRVLVENHGSQCGFCTPGIVMSMYTLLRTDPVPTEHMIERALQGNLCRCTGYRPILQGFKMFTAEGRIEDESNNSGGASGVVLSATIAARIRKKAKPQKLISRKTLRFPCTLPMMLLKSQFSHLNSRPETSARHFCLPVLELPGSVQTRSWTFLSSE